MNPQISIIVPVYNGERYLHECIDSILNQSFTDFELILVVMAVKMALPIYAMITQRKTKGYGLYINKMKV